MTAAPQPLAPDSPLTMGPDFVDAPILAENYPAVDYPVSYGLQNGTIPPPTAFVPPQAPAKAQRLLVFVIDSQTDASTVGLASWQAAANAVIAALAGTDVVTQTDFARFSHWPQDLGQNILTVWTSGSGFNINDGGPVPGQESAKGFSGDVLVYYAFSLSYPSTSPPAPHSVYQYFYNLLKATLNYDAFSPGSLPLNHRFTAYVSRLSTADSPVGDAQAAAWWDSAKGGFGGAYPLAAISVVPDAGNPDLDTVKAFFGIT